MKGRSNMNCGMCAFVSEEAARLHKEYFETLRLRYSVMEKSFPEIKSGSAKPIMRMRREYKEEILDLRADIACHELYFDSFGEKYQASSAVREEFGSEASFLYEIFNASKSYGAEFIVVFIDRKKIGLKVLSNATEILRIQDPVLCIDLCEHSYFLDYGFDKGQYVSSSLPYLNIAVLDKFLSNKH